MDALEDFLGGVFGKCEEGILHTKNFFGDLEDWWKEKPPAIKAYDLKVEGEVKVVSKAIDGGTRKQKLLREIESEEQLKKILNAKGAIYKKLLEKAEERYTTEARETWELDVNDSNVKKMIMKRAASHVEEELRSILSDPE